MYPEMAAAGLWTTLGDQLTNCRLWGASETALDLVVGDDRLVRAAKLAQCDALVGATFCEPVVISPIVFAPVRTLDGKRVRTGDILPEFAAGPEGNLYGVWQDGRFSPTGAAKVALSMSRDGGFTWSSPIRIDQSVGNSQAFTPVVQTASDGTVGVTYYDFENATAARPGLTDTFIVHCHAATSAAPTRSAGQRVVRPGSARLALST